MIPTLNSCRAVHSADENLDVNTFWGSPFSALLGITAIGSANNMQPKSGVAKVGDRDRLTPRASTKNLVGT